MNAEQLIGDISLELARRAHYGTSFSPDTRGDQEREGYAQTLAADYEMLRENAEKGGTLNQLDSEFAQYRIGYRQRYTQHLHKRSSCLSTMIAGPSKFPTRRAEKANNAERRAYDDLIQFRERALRAILRTLRPDLRPIMSGDDNALDRAKEKLTKLEKSQENMRAANKIIHGKPKNGRTPEKETALIALGVPQAVAIALFEPDFAGRIGFADYQLTNNAANIRRVKQQIERLTETKAAPEVEIESESGIRFEDSPPDNRVRLFFPDKPDAAIRGRLKANGFRWAPSIAAWQAFRNYKTIELAKEIAGIKS